MKLILKGHRYVYEIENTVRSFGVEISDISFDGTWKKSKDDGFCYSRLVKSSKGIRLLIAVKLHGDIRMVKTSHSSYADKKEIEFSFCDAVFNYKTRHHASCFFCIYNHLLQTIVFLLSKTDSYYTQIFWK